MSSFYNTEEQKMKAYKANLKKEAANQFKQSEKLQEYLLYEKGIETSERGLDRFAEAIGEKVGENVGVVGKVDRTKQIPTSQSVGSIKKVQFDPTAIAEVDESGVSIKRKSAKQPKSIAQPPKPKTMTKTNPQVDLENRQAEMKSMATEDALSRLSAAITAATTRREVSGMAAEDAISAFRELSDKEDAKIRQKFMNVLDEMIDKSKTQKDIALISRLQDLIEKNRMAEAFERLEQNRLDMNDAFANKIQRNLKAAFENKKFMRAVSDSNEDMKRNKAATTIQQRMAELRARKASKRDRLVSGVSTASNDSEETDIGSLAGVSLRGRPPKFQKEELLTEAMRAKDQADSLSQKLFEREGVKSNGTPIYKIRGEERKKLAKKIDNLYSRANRLYNQHMS